MIKNKKRLKDKIWRDVVIKIDRLVEQYQDGIIIENKCIAFLITIEHGQGRKTMFRVNNIRQLWKEIKHFSMIYK
jgi:hypothetical protein